MSTLLKRLSSNKCIKSPLQTRLFSTQFQQKKFEPHIYSGPTEKPSLLIRNHHIDSSIWSDIELVDTDIFINTPAKAGTTWTQEIVAQLLYNGDYENKLNVQSIWEVSIWAALTIMPKEAKLQHLSSQLSNPAVTRRIIKTHEPIESMPYNPNIKYLFVARDYRDVVWSMYNHYRLFKDEAIDLFNAEKGYPFKKLPKYNFEDGSFKEYDLWQMMLNEPTVDEGLPDGWPWWSQLWVIGSWWRVKDLPNVKMIHYNNLKEDLPGNMKDIARFLEIEYDESKFDELVKNCSIEKMRGKKEPLGSVAHALFKDPKGFFNKGEKGRWSDVLSEEDTENYRHLARRYMDEDGIYWLETGKFD